jgi:hypothetical protein
MVSDSSAKSYWDGVTLDSSFLFFICFDNVVFLLHGLDACKTSCSNNFNCKFVILLGSCFYKQIQLSNFLYQIINIFLHPFCMWQKHSIIHNLSRICSTFHNSS